MPSSRPATRFLDILDNIRLIQGYLQGMDRAAFEADSRTRDAVERCLERLSEAATKLGSRAEELAPKLKQCVADFYASYSSVLGKDESAKLIQSMNRIADKLQG